MDTTRTTHRPVRRLGQNFLRDRGVAAKIVDAAELRLEDSVLEPGAGTGFLTRLLTRRVRQVIAVEKDPQLATLLREQFSHDTHVITIEGDVLKTVLPPFTRVVGTPPYYLSSKLVFFLAGRRFDKAHLVFQKEFGERMIAAPGTADYGRLSVMAQRSFQVDSLFSISRHAFQPTPKVDSVLVSLAAREGTASPSPIFEETVRGLFNQRKRLVKGAFVHYLALKIGKRRARAITGKVLLPEGRVYQLTLEQFEAISTELERLLLAES